MEENSSVIINDHSVRTDLTVTCTSSISDNSVDENSSSMALLSLSAISPGQRLTCLGNQVKLLETNLSRKCVLLKVLGDKLKASEIKHAQELTTIRAEKDALEVKHRTSLETERQYLHKFQEQITLELATILNKQKALEATNQRLQMEEKRRKEYLDQLLLQENELSEFCKKDQGELALPEYAAAKLWEARKLAEDARHDNAELQFTLDQIRSEHLRSQAENVAMKAAQENNQRVLEESLEELAAAKLSLSGNLFSYENFVSLQKERCDLKTVLHECQRQLKRSQMQGLETVELRKLNTEAQRSQEALMKELTGIKLEFDSVKIQNQELHEKNKKLTRECQGLKKKFSDIANEAQTNFSTELERLRETTRLQLHQYSSADKDVVLQLERARDKALEERDILERKCDAYTQKLYTIQNALRVKEFELEKSELLRQETNRKANALETAKLVLRQDLEKAKMDYQEDNARLVQQNRTLINTIQDLQSRLEEQKTIAQELEEAFLQVTALAEHSHVLNVSPILQRQFKQSQEIGRRVVELESVNRILHQTLQTAQEKLSQLEEDLHSKDKLLHGLSNNAAPQMISLVREKDAQIRQLRSLLEAKDCQLLDCMRELENLRQGNQRLTEDLEKVLKNRQEIEKLRQQLGQYAQH